MQYYKTWQEAFKDFLEHYGHNYQDSYNLAAEFEDRLKRNAAGTYFIYFGEE